MKDSRQSLISFSTEDVRDKTSERAVEVSTPHEQRVNTITVENNPKIDHELLSEFYRVTEEYERLVAASKGIVRVVQGADYHLSHPLGSNDVSTDPREIGKSLSEAKNT